MQAYLQPCSQSSNSAVIGLHRLRSSTNRCALLALPTPRTACLPTVEVVRGMGHDSCHGCCSDVPCRVCDWLDLLIPSMHHFHVNGGLHEQSSLSPSPASAASSRESNRGTKGAKRFSGLGRRPEAIHTLTGRVPAPVTVNWTSRWFSPPTERLGHEVFHLSSPRPGATEAVRYSTLAHRKPWISGRRRSTCRLSERPV